MDLAFDACHQSSKSTFDPCSPADPDKISPRMAVRLARWLAIVGIVCFPFSQFSTHLFFTRCLPTARIRFTIFIFLSSPDFPTVKHTWVTPYALPAVARAFFLAAAYSWPLAAPGLNFLRFSRSLEKAVRLLKCLVNGLLRRSVRVFSVFTLSSRAEARGAGGPKLHAALARRILPTLGQCDSLSCSAILQGVMCIFFSVGAQARHAACLRSRSMLHQAPRPEGSFTCRERESESSRRSVWPVWKKNKQPNSTRRRIDV